MRIILYILFVLTLFFQGCDYFQWDLERDNPLDNSATEEEQGKPEIEFSKINVNSDDNGDQIINPGESIQLMLYLKNTGSSLAEEVRATVTTGSSYITNLTNNTDIIFGSIDPGGEEYGGYTSLDYLRFDVLSSTPEGETITFNIEITDESNNTWSDTFTITVVGTGASIGFSRYELRIDSNNDDQINPGESITLKVFLKNYGSSRANKVRATISCTSDYISSISPTSEVNYYHNGSSGSDYIDVGGEGYPTFESDFLSFNVSNTTPEGTEITFNIEITDEQNNAWDDSFSITVE